jgi:uncharacterized SAM-binding protein YcdF (DUF218 family)
MRKKIRIVLLLIAVLFSNPFIYRTISMWWQPAPAHLPAGTQYSVGILLGGMSMYDARDTGYFGNNADCFIQAANLYHSGQIRKVLISGGTGSLLSNEPTEARFLLKELLRNGVKKEDIIVEADSRNTFENALFSKKILDSLQLQQPFVVITSAQHMPRSMMVFRHAGFINPVAYPCDYKVIDARFSFEDSFIPDIKLLKDWQYLIKEFIGVIAYRITGKL